MRCYNVVCKCEDGTEENVGVVCDTPEHAKINAVNSLLEGKHKNSVAIEVQEVDAI